MNRHFLLKAAFSMALCIPPWGGVFEWLTPQAKAQGEAFAFAPKWADMLDPAATLAIAGVPTSAENNRYHGQAATLSQFVRTDDNGNVLLFGVDGNIYDGLGYLIAGVKTTDPYQCQECVEPGVMEMICTPVPGLCGVFYIFSMRSEYDPGELSDAAYPTRLAVALLDINLPNVYHTGRYGALVYTSEAIDPPYGMSLMTDPYMEGSVTGMHGWAQHSGKGGSTAPMMRLIDPTGGGEMYWLFIINTTTISVYKVDGEGLLPIQYNNDFIPIRSDWTTGQNGSEKAYYRDASVIKTTGNEVRLAITDKGVSRWTWSGSDYDFDGSGAVVWLRFNATTGALIGNTVHGIQTSDGLPPYYVSGSQPTNLPTGYSGGPAGIAWLSGGERFLLAGDVVEGGNWVHKTGIFNVTTNDWTDLTSSLGVQYPENYFYARFNRNSVNGGIMNALYLPRANGLAAILTADATPVWESTVPLSGAVVPPTYMPPSGSSLYAPRFINAQVVNDPHLGNWNFVSDACCATQEDFKGQPGITAVQGNTSGTPWEPGANPFGGGSEVVITSDLIIDNSIDLYIEDMTFRFSPTARLILKPGAYARFKNCTLTSYRCDNTRWPGVRVEGNTGSPQDDATDAQGRLLLDHTTVSNAVIGVWAATATAYNPNSNGYGGVIWAYYATFKNNLIGAMLGRYHENLNQDGIEDNRSYFHSTRFITDDEWPDSYIPSYHLNVEDTRKVNVFLCTFANDATFSPVAGQGNGLRAWKAEVSVKGSSTGANDLGYVRNLRTGILKLGGPDEPITVDRMRFSGNWTGIDDVAGHLSRYINNAFNVPDVLTVKRYGIKLNQSSVFTVERNTFTGSVQAMNNSHQSVGIWFSGILPDQTLPWIYDDEEIYDNDFTDLHTGCLVNRMHRSADGGPNDAGLQIYCGDYLNNTEDIGIGPRSIIRPNQFELDPPQLAGNRFLDAANCSSNYDWNLDEFWNVDVAPYEGMSIIYHRLNNTVCAAICPTEVDDQFNDQPVGEPAAFIEATECGNGKLDLGRSRTEAEAAYATARTLCVQAKALLDGATDGGNRPDLLAELAQDHPWLGTGFLRDRLMLNSPLSNEVLDAMIEREQPMDPWHITQVCIENSPLDPGIVGLLKPPGVLGEFFYAIVLQAQEGLGPSARQLLQQEYMLRRGQQARALAEVGWLWATDTIAPGGADSLRNTLEHAAGLDHRWARMARRLFAGDMTGANALEGDLRELNGFVQLQAVIEMGTAHGGDWSLLDSVEVDSLIAYALSGLQGSAIYEGLLEGHNLAVVETEAIFPDKFRNMRAGDDNAPAADTFAITSYPTPADNEAWIRFPIELSGTGYRIEDAQGKVVQQGRLANGGLMPLSTATMTSGMYAIVSSEGTARGRMLVKH